MTTELEMLLGYPEIGDPELESFLLWQEQHKAEKMEEEE